MTPLQKKAWRALEGGTATNPIDSHIISHAVWGEDAPRLRQQCVYSLIRGLRAAGYRIGSRRGHTGGYWRIEE